MTPASKRANQRSPRIPLIDFARGFAMLSIVVFHAIQPVASGAWAHIIQFGGAGVHLFVFLSGFGLTLSPADRSWSQFYVRRMTRIVIPYFLFVTIVFLLNVSLPVYPHDGVYAYLGHLLLFKMFDESIMTSYGYPLWFLSTLIQFYLIYPLLCRLMEVLGSRWLFSAALLLSFVYCVGILVIGCSNERVFNSSCIVFLWEFVLGMVAGKAYLERNYAFWQIPWGWLAVGTCSCLAIYGTMSLSMGAVGRTFNDPFALFAFMGCMILAYRISKRRMPMLNDKIAFLSIFSYEIYLIHALVLKLNWGILHPTTMINGLAASVAGTSLAVVIGYAYWQFVNHISRARWRPVNVQ